MGKSIKYHKQTEFSLKMHNFKIYAIVVIIKYTYSKFINLIFILKTVKKWPKKR